MSVLFECRKGGSSHYDHQEGICDRDLPFAPPPADPPMAPGAIKNGAFELKDTGHRKVFETGAQRDAGPGKGYFHCLPFVAMERLAQLYEAGAVKYGRDNWKRGIPLSCYLDSLLRHGMKLSEAWVDEDHAAAAMWNAAGFMWTANEILVGRLPRSLDNIGYIAALEAKHAPPLDLAAAIAGAEGYTPPKA